MERAHVGRAIDPAEFLAQPFSFRKNSDASRTQLCATCRTISALRTYPPAEFVFHSITHSNVENFARFNGQVNLTVCGFRAGKTNRHTETNKKLPKIGSSVVNW